MPPKKAKAKPLTQKAEKEMMGAEDIASTAKELDDAKAKAVARMAKAREAKKAKASLPSKENITMKVEEKKEEAPYGYTKSGKKRTKPLKEKAPKKEAKKAKPQPTLQDRILALPDEVRRYASEFVPTPVSIKNARRYIQLLEKGKDILLKMVAERGMFWTQDGYYTTAGDKGVDEIMDDLDRTYGDFKDVLKGAKLWFSKTYKGQKYDFPRELRKSDEKIFEPDFFGLSENRYYDPNAEYGDDEFNGEYHLSDYTDLEEGIENAMSVLKQIIDVLKEGEFVSPVEIDEESDDDEIDGGALSAKELKDLLGASYDPKIDKVGDFVLDSKLSTKTSKVYHNANSGQTVVAHKGTEGILDWGNNAVYALGGKSAYKMTPRYKEAEKVQKKAESKYGAKNVSTIGHSQGGLQAELLGGKSKEIITLNKATRPFESNKNKNQTDVRSGRDVVSALNPFEKKSSKNVEIQGETYNPLAEHSGDVLDRLDENQMIGEGIEGGATYGQRSLSNFFRSRFNPKLIKGADERYINSKLPKDARGNLLYTIMELQALLNEITHSADIFGIAPLNPYTDYKERPTYVDKPRNYVWNARTGATIDPVPTPEEVLGIVQNAYYSLYEDMLDRKGGFKNKQYLFGEKEKTLPSEIGNTYYADWFRTQKVPLAEKEAKEKVRAKPALFISKDITEQLKAKGRKAKTVVAEREKQMKEDAWWIDKNSPKYYPLSKLFDAWLKSVNAVNQAEKDRVERSIDDEMNKLKEDLRMFNEKYGYEKQPAKFNPVVKPVPIPTLTLTQASKSYKWTNPLPKAPEPTLKATAQEFKPKGSGLPTPVVMGGAINFEDMNWGSLTEQMKAYNSQHSKDMDLEGFARMIVADPKSFQKRTLKRARFYLNVLLPKKK